MCVNSLKSLFSHHLTAHTSFSAAGDHSGPDQDGSVGLKVALSALMCVFTVVAVVVGFVIYTKRAHLEQKSNPFDHEQAATEPLQYRPSSLRTWTSCIFGAT